MVTMGMQSTKMMRSSPTLFPFHFRFRPRRLTGSPPQMGAHLRLLLRLFVLALLLVVAYKGVRAAFYGVAAYQDVAELQALRTRPLTPTEKLGQAERRLASLSTVMAGLDQELGPFYPLLRLARPLPGYGPALAAGPDLVDMGIDLLAVARDALTLAPTQLAAAVDRGDTGALLALLETLSRQDPTLAGRLAQVEARLDQLPVSSFPPVLAGPLDNLQVVLQLATPALRSAPVLPQMLGFQGPRTYLILVQNNHELRATGGFLSGIGTLRLENGAITHLEFVDSYDIGRDDVEHPWAPAPMQRYMGIDLLFLRDVNWSPDLPTTAQLARAIYQQDTGNLVDGVVTLDLHAVQLLVGALEPLTVPAAAEPLTADNVVDQIKEFWNRPPESEATLQEGQFWEWWERRKDFMPMLAQAFLAKLQRGQFDFLKLANALYTALDERAIQIWVEEPILAAELARMDWDGGLRPPSQGDFLALVDTNMGYNKVDAVVRRKVQYTVTWPTTAGESPLAQAMITYEHPLAVPGHQCDNTPRYGSGYDDMLRRCYFNYVRLYVPAGSELLEAEGVEADSVVSQRGENNTQLFAGYFVMLPGSRHTVTFTYRLPPDLTPENYTLAIRRQAGSPPLPVTIRVDGQETTVTVTRGRYIWPAPEAKERSLTRAPRGG